MIQEPVRVRLELESHPENVTLVRAALAGLADAAELGEELLADLKTAVSEACNNVVLHAYADTDGPMIVRIEAIHDGIDVIVADRGRGFTRISGVEGRMGLGLAVISALSDRAEFCTPEGGGTEVRMGFKRETAIARGDAGTPWPREPGAQIAGDVIAWFSPVELSRFVLGRIFRALAAASNFSVTRFSDLYAVNDAIAGYAELAADGGVGVAISSSTRRLSMTGGPFPVPPAGTTGETAARADRISELETRKQALADVVDGLRTENVDGRQLLHLVLLDASRHSG